MDIDWYFKLLLIIGLLLLSAFFSGSESALFALDKGRLKQIKENSPIIGEYITKLLEFPKRLLVTILLCNTVIKISIALVSVKIALDTAVYFSWPVYLILFLQAIIVTLLILIAGEILPRLAASRYPEATARFVSIPLYWVGVMVYPVTATLTDMIKGLFSKVRNEKKKSNILSSELADLGIEKGSMEAEEQELIHGLVSFRSISVREIMTPRVDIVAVSDDSEFDEMLNIITESGHSRIPLYHSNLDEITGIIYTKDLLPYLKNGSAKEKLQLSKIARKAMFIPETKMISELMHEFQEKKLHMGIVVDEYGGTAGLITLEDILEEIVGEIRDEYDLEEESDIIKTGDNLYSVLGKTPIDEIKERLDLDLYSENDDYDTIGGFIFNYTGEIPKEGYSFVYKNHKFTISEIENRRIKKIYIEILSPIDQPDNEI